MLSYVCVCVCSVRKRWCLGVNNAGNIKLYKITFNVSFIYEVINLLFTLFMSSKFNFILAKNVQCNIFNTRQDIHIRQKIYYKSINEKWHHFPKQHVPIIIIYIRIIFFERKKSNTNICFCQKMQSSCLSFYIFFLKKEQTIYIHTIIMFIVTYI